MTDRELLQELARTGREDLLALAISRHSDMVYSLCLRMLADRHAAEDAAQATFILLWRKRSQLSPDTILSGWLYQTSRHVAMTAIRARARRVRHEQEAAKMRTELRTTPPEAAWADVQPHLDTAMAALPRRQRDALVLRFLRDCDVEETASQLRCSRDSVRSLIRRAIVRLRGKLGKAGVSIGSATLAGMMATEAVQAAPASLAASIHAACLGKAAATTSIFALVKETTMAMFVAKVKVLAATAAAAVVALSVAGTGVYTVLAADPAPKPAATRPDVTNPTAPKPEGPMMAAASPAATRPDAPKAVPLGHKDFYPSAEHPIGERGDRTGLFPGAKDVALEWDDRTGKNIVWKCRLPRWSNAAPIVVGKKAFVATEPDELICVDTETGKILWKRSLMIDQFIPEADREAVRTAFRQVEDQTMALDLPGRLPQFWVEAAKPFVDPAVSEMAERIAKTRKYVEETTQKPIIHVDAYHVPEDIIVSNASYEILKKYKIITFGKRAEKNPFSTFAVHFFMHTGYTMPTPVSDGKHVWMYTALGALACLDLDGKIIWNKQLDPLGPMSSDSLYECGSPLLMGDRLIYTRGGRHIFAVEKLTGKELWNTRPKKGIGGRGSGGVINLRVGGKEFVQCPGRPILDPATGKQVGELPEFDTGLNDIRRGHTAVGDGSLIWISAGMIGRAQLTLEDDQVTSREIWRCGKVGISMCPSWYSIVVYDGGVYYPRGSAQANALKWMPYEISGKETEAERASKLKTLREVPDDTTRFNPPRGVGNTEKKSCWRDKLPKNERAQTDGGCNYGLQSVAEGHLFTGDDNNGILVVKLAGENSETVSRNFMDIMIRGNPFFQGNRMYVRSAHYLYCIGKTN